MTAQTAPAAPSVAIVGLGLIGASLCLAMRRALPAMRIVGVARRPQTAERALADGACDIAGTDASLLAGADVVVLCTPVTAMPAWLGQCAQVAPDALVTDCGSTKAWVVDRAAAVAPDVRFLGGHPMAGREQSGYDAADASLFEGCTWVLTPRGGCDDGLDGFAPWTHVLGALRVRVEVLDPHVHDQAVAWISHVPFVLSATLMSAATSAPSWPHASLLAASGFRDAVRLAGGDPAMYAAITATNTAAIGAVLDAVESEVSTLRGLLGDHSAAHAYFGGAREHRERWLTERAAAGRAVPGTAPAGS